MRLVLVVCPSNLRFKWKHELRQCFGEDFRILRAPELNAFFDDYEEYPDRVELNGIVSLEAIRSEGIRARLEALEVPFDLIIVDEAHHLRNFATAQRNAGEALLRPAGAVVMLTATPIHLGQENLFSLLNLLDDEDFPELATSQSRFADNKFIVRAQSAIGKNPPDIRSAQEILGQRRGAHGSRPIRCCRRSNKRSWFLGSASRRTGQRNPKG